MKRFWDKVIKSPNCWEWQGAKCSDGYGSIKIDGKTVGTHRVSWELHFGKIPRGQVVMHTCDNPACIRPDHLVLGTQVKNIKDRNEKGRTAKGQQHADSKLTPEQVLSIRKEYLTLPNYNAIGRKYNVAPMTIRKIILGHSWKHVQ